MIFFADHLHQNGRVSPRKPAGENSDKGASPSPLHKSPPDSGAGNRTSHSNSKTPQSSTTTISGKRMPKLEPATSGGSMDSLRGINRPPKIEEET